MLSPVKYQVFVSSTFEDLREERNYATQSILTMGHFPSGMELFTASDDAQWDLIKRVIEEADYYVVIVGGRYGSVGPTGFSYTEMEYDYAVQLGIPVLGFVRENVDDIPGKFLEKSPENRAKLDAFRSKVMSKTCKPYNSPSELGMHVMASLTHEMRVRPREGWIRANQARSEEDVERQRKLESDLEEAQEALAQLDRELRDREVLVDEIPKDQLAQGDDIVTFTVKFTNSHKTYVAKEVELTWDEVFSAIAPRMYGYILRRGGARYNQSSQYTFQDDLESLIRTKIISEIGSRKMTLSQSDIDTCVFQFKELGLIKFTEKTTDDGDNFRGISLTPLGEQKISRLKTGIRKRKKASSPKSKD